MAVQIAVRIPDSLADELEELVRRGVYPTTAEAVRDAVRQMTDRERRRALDDAIAEGYRQHPPTKAESNWADRSGRDLIAEEPW